ncbi:phenylalanine--tRNA ligase subunit beta [Schinkia sp. CFF1]
MLVSYNWLKDYVDINDITAEELAEKITKAGIEVEGVEVLNKGVQGVVIGHVLECVKHPEADKLNICQVDLGEEEPKQIICGAPNVAAGQKVIVAKIGAVLPGNFKIKKAKLRGEASNGMICSLQELGIESKFVPKEYASGIFVFPFEVEVGTDPLEYLNLHDQVLELSLTPNRSDALSMLGVAYEVAAILGREVKLPKPVLHEVSEKAADYIKITVDAEEDCPYYAARVVKGVKIAPSPLWMQMRLMAAGIRPINNVVDITNYILIEYGQPLHAFDYDRLGSKEILVRRAKQDEKFITLDDQERTLKADQLVITNGTEPVALAGVMGGANSEVHDGTVNVLIEAAVFNGQTVRQASKDHGLRSEASTRFEKGVDPLRTKEAGDRAAALMAELAGGEVLEGVVAVDNLDTMPIKVTVSTNRINQVLGTTITTEDVTEIFTRLQFDFTEETHEFTVTAPSRRRDIAISEDLIEEVARLYGYDYIPTTLPIGDTTPGKLSAYQHKRRKIRRFLEGAGLTEAVTYSLTSSDRAELYKDETTKATPIRLAMPMSEERSTLRLSLVPHLLEAVAHNNARQLENVALYEIGKVYLIDGKIETIQPNERENLAGAITGLWQTHSWQGEKKAVDFFVAKGILEGLFEMLGLQDRITFEQGQKDGLHPGRTAMMKLDQDYLGFVGQVHPEVQKTLDLHPTYVFEININKLLRTEVEEIQYEAIPRFPSITRDIALVVDENVVAGTVQAVIQEAGGKLLKEVTIFDLYQGEHLEKGKKSIAFSLRYFDPEKTLTDEEVVKAHELVLKAVEEKLGATLRG